MADLWVVIPGWEKFQHYKDRRPAWIKDYPDQLDRDEYLQLSPTARALLQDVRRLYALRDGQVRRDGVATRVGMRPSAMHWKELTDAGFLAFVASQPLALHARARVETEREKERETPKSPLKKKQSAQRKAEAWIRNGLASQVPPERLPVVIADEFGIHDPDLVNELVALATEGRNDG